MPDPRIVYGAAAEAALLRGVDLMTGLLRPTLGPTPRTVAVGRLVGGGPPEILDNAATIARRTIQLVDPFEDMGGMIVRHVIWQVFERAGDGTATAAVLAHRLMHEAARYLAAGASPAAVKRGIERGLDVALVELRRHTRKLELPAEIARVVAGSIHRMELARTVGEVVDAVGPDGAILVEDAHGSATTCEYIDGVRWNEGYVSPFLLGDRESTTMRLVNPRVFISEYPLDRAAHLLPAVEACVAAGDRSLLVVAPEVRDSAVGLLVVNRERGVLDGAIAVRAPSFGDQRTRILEDLAVITGGRCLRPDARDQLADVCIGDLGKARQAWATRFAFGILGGQGSKEALRQRLSQARAELAWRQDDEFTREKIKERIGKLAGTTAVIRVGAPTSAEQEELKLRVEAAVRSARAALCEGVVPGGGAGLLACVPAMEEVEAVGDEAAGVRALGRALTEPMRVIVRNAGLEPGPVVHEARRRGPPWMFDVLQREWVEAWSAGVVDPVRVVQTALETSVSAATTTLTAAVLVRRKRPSQAIDP